MKRTQTILKFFSPTILLTIQSAIWAFVWINFYANSIPNPFQWKGELLLAALYFIILLIITNFYGGLRVGHYRASEVTLSEMIALFFTNAVTYAQVCLISSAIVTPLPIITMTVAQYVVAWVWVTVTYKIYVRVTPSRKMLLLYGESEAAKRLIQKFITRSEKYQIQESLCVTGQELDAIHSRILDFEAVILCGIPPDICGELLKYCFYNTTRTYTVPGIEDILTRNSVEINLFDMPLLLNRNERLDVERRTTKRVMDILISTVALIILSPLSILTAISIKLCDGGRALFSQERLTIGGKSFTLLKFRSMKQDAEENGAQLSTKSDNRITLVGRIIRPLRLDEIPQLLNVLKGDMSIVGPRPERPEIAEEYCKAMPEFAHRLKVKAGLTGYAQVYGNYNTDPWDKLLMDLTYISSYSPAMDIKIIFMTVKTLFQRERTKGIADGHITPRKKQAETK